MRPDLYEEERKKADFGTLTELLQVISIRDWMKVVRRLQRSRPLHVKVDRSYGFRHPWHCRPSYNGDKGRWEVDIQISYVNSKETVVKLLPEDAPLRAIERARKESGQSRLPKAELIPCYLSDRPQLPVAESLLRPIGDGPALEGTEPVPEQFLVQGVSPERYEVTSSLDSGLRSSLTGPIPDASRRRWLRAFEVVLRQPRPALRMEFTGGDGEPVLQMRVDNPVDKTPVLNLRRVYQGVAEVSGIEQLLAGATDRAYDEQHIATVYLLSPIGAGPSAVPDGLWTSEVEHHCFYNLRHGIDQDLEAIPQRSLRLPGTGLAGGIGDGLIEGFERANEQLVAEAEALLNRSRIQGRFWSK